jgi:hypothetical protein
MLVSALLHIYGPKSYPNLSEIEKYLNLTDTSVFAQINQCSGVPLLRSAIESRIFPSKVGLLPQPEPDQRLNEFKGRLNGKLLVFTDRELVAEPDLSKREGEETVWVDTGTTFTSYKTDSKSQIRLRDSRYERSTDVQDRLRSKPLTEYAMGLRIEDALLMSSYRVYCGDNLGVRNLVEETIRACGGVT